MEKTIRAKFSVQRVDPQEYPQGVKHTERVVLSPVYSADPNSENHAFWAATPNGHLEMYVSNPQAWGMFTAGQEFYLDFTPVPKPPPEPEA
jgi:hypothetical protein